MTTEQFTKTLMEFLLQACPDKVVSIEFRIELQPGLVSFGGDYTLQDGIQSPVDIREIGKIKCGELSNHIQSFHRETTNGGREKWNKGFFRFDQGKQVESRLIWDEKFEEDNIRSYQQNQELIRQNWYWEEK